MNLLSLIIIFLALAICGAIAFIAWELTSEKTQRRAASRITSPPDAADASDETDAGQR